MILKFDCGVKANMRFDEGLFKHLEITLPDNLCINSTHCASRILKIIRRNSKFSLYSKLISFHDKSSQRIIEAIKPEQNFKICQRKSVFSIILNQYICIYKLNSR